MSILSFLKFSYIGFWNSSANCWSNVLSLSISLLAASLSKDLYTIEARPLWYQSYFGFLAILNALSRNILSEAIPLVKSLKPTEDMSC